jgi:hypothetical protein
MIATVGLDLPGHSGKARRMKHKSCLAIILAGLGGCATPVTPGEHRGAIFALASAPSSGDFNIEAEIQRVSPQIEQFFGGRFRGPVEVTLARDRAEFDGAIPATWGLTPTQCWMVGVGVADRLVLMAPDAWGTYACDHRPGDKAEARAILHHELVHVYHGQHNPSDQFAGMDDAGWFVEGLAVYASGDVTRRLPETQAAVAAGEGPSALASAWSGKHRYGVSGSMIQFIDENHGRDLLVSLLSATSNAEIMARLGTTETRFLHDWTEWLRRK